MLRSKIKFNKLNMIALLVGVCQAFSLTQIATPSRYITSPAKFNGLSSLFLFGTFSDLDASNYQVKIGEEHCQILSVKADEIECIIPPWDENDPSNPTVEVSHNSGITDASNSFQFWRPVPAVTFNPNEAVAGDTINYYFLRSSSVDVVLKLQGVSMSLASNVIENQSPYILDVTVGSNTHGESSVEYKLNNLVRGFLWTAGYTLEGEEYPFRTIATINSVSFDLQTPLGELSAAITGDSLPSDVSRILIEVHGTECQVTQIGLNSIDCASADYFDLENQEFYEGSAGLVREIYTQGNIGVPSQLVERKIIPSATILASTSNHDSLIYGLFKAPTSGSYTFYASFRGSVRVYLSSDGTSSNKVRIINSNDSSEEHVYFTSENNESEPLTLVGGQSYYLEVEHFGLASRSSFSLGVEVPGSGQRNGMPLVKRVDTSSAKLSNTFPFTYKGQSKQLVNFDPSLCSTEVLQNQNAISQVYFNLYGYCHGNYFYALLPSYMSPQPSDLEFKVGGTDVQGETLHQPSNSQFWFVIPSDLLRTYETKPQLRVWIDNRLTLCRGDCSFEPLIQSFFESSKLVTINGEKFPKDASKIQVKIGNSDCTVQSNSHKAITCLLDSYTEGEYQPQVTYKTYTISLSPEINYYIELYCASNCLKCYSNSPFQCIECKTGWFLVNKVCISTCPTDYSCSSKGSSSISDSFVFHLQLSTMQNLVRDSRNSIPVLTGTNDQFHPFFDKTDPYPSKDRGYYFRGSSVMQLPPFSGFPSPLLVLAPEFAVSTWVRPTSGSGTLLSKKDQNMGSILEIQLLDFKVSVELSSSFETSQLSSYWDLLLVKSFFENSEFKLEVYFNNTQVLSKGMGSHWLADTETNHFTIGASASENFGNFFRGFIWELRIYNSAVSPESLLSQCRNCQFCPLENQCLPVCEVDEYWNGEHCEECKSDCYFGCIANTTCSLCGNDLCTECQFEVCTACVESASINSGKTCECDQGYIEEYGFCNRGTFSANLTNKDNTLNLEFSEPLDSPLATSDLQLSLNNQTIKYTYSFRELDSKSFQITMSFNSFVSKGELVFLVLAPNITSNSNYLLETQELQTFLYEHNPAIALTEQVKGQVEVLTTTSVSVVTLSGMLSPNPSTLWRLMNTLEILSYITISSNPLTPSVRGLFEGMNFLESFRKYLDIAFESTIGYNSANYFSQFPQNLFLVSAIANIFVLVVFLVLWPFIWVFSKLKLECLQKKLKNWLREYKYNLFVRYWIQCYLDLAIACFFQLAALPTLSIFEVVNYLSACLVVFCVVVTPLGLYLFNRKFKQQITLLGAESIFHLDWGTMFYEFKHNSSFLASHTYLLFISQRLVFAASLGFLGNYPYIQACINALVALVYALFIWIVRPYSQKSQQTTTSVSETAVFVIFVLVVFFLNKDWESNFSLVETLITYTVIGVILIQTAASLWDLGYRVYSCLKEDNRVADLQEDQSRVFEIRRTDFNITETFQRQACSPSEFFRSKN